VKVHFLTSGTSKSRAAHRLFVQKYGQTPLDQAEVIVSLSGDGMVLRAFHENIKRHNIPIYGMNRGGVGFLTNKYSVDNLLGRIANAQQLKINPLIMTAEDSAKNEYESIAINEVYVVRDSNQTTKIRLTINDEVKIKELMCDGLIVSSTVGSTAYNFSAGGPVLPLGCGLLSVTAISSFRPRRWGGAVIPDSYTVTLEVLEGAKRPVKAVADYVEFPEMAKISIRKDKSACVTLLLDSVDDLQNRMINEQFVK